MSRPDSAPTRREPRSASRRGRGGVVIASLLATLMLTSCQGVPVVSDREPAGDATVEELREWVGGEVDAVTELTGLDSRWRMLLELELRWPEDRERIFDRSHLPRCSTQGGGTNPAAVEVDLLSDPLEEDPVALAGKVRDHWEDAGWDISQVGPGYYRADRADGALMTVEGAEGAGGKLLSLTVRSACSSNPSVAH